MSDPTLKLLFKPEQHAPNLVRYRRAQQVWRALPMPQFVRLGITSLFYRMFGRLRSMAALNLTLEATHLAPRPAAKIAPGRLILSGYLSDTSGIGRAGRMSAEALRRANLSPILHDLRHAPEGWGQVEPGGVWFCHCNAIEAADFLLRVEAPRACYRISYWAWELPDIPPEWADVAPLFHEIWAPSRFVLDGLKRAMPKSRVILRHVPHPLPAVEKVRPDRQRYDLADDVFAFLCMYDVHSSATRKNPMGAIKAFQMAFEPSREDVVLLVKVVAAAESISCLDDLIAATQGWPNIRLLTDMLSDEDANRLICSADAFVSLHRSEGFGLSIAQAMAMGRPVIVTAWSGNMDFCGGGAALVGYSLIPAKDPYGVYHPYEAPGQVWADPDLEAAAQAMRRFAEDRPQARELGSAARRHIREVLPDGYDVTPLLPWIA